MKPNIPSPRFEEKDATRLIANFGAKPSEETKEQIQTLIKDQKEQFLGQERQREARARGNRSW